MALKDDRVGQCLRSCGGEFQMWGPKQENVTRKTTNKSAKFEIIEAFSTSSHEHMKGLLSKCTTLKGLLSKCTTLKGLLSKCTTLKGLLSKCTTLKGLLSKCTTLKAELTQSDKYALCGRVYVHFSARKTLRAGAVNVLK